ncbi:uncharacterized protein LOC131238799 [Magnolia sinica]|uniref:uncharacterized protein LOC131238799 n=1 Tax=Magnolia sinica TaxID=86752 RepID=UPI002658EFBB|nr:uncharacterized protein LOC131238799 [Magnolia sinica]
MEVLPNTGVRLLYVVIMAIYVGNAYGRDDPLTRLVPGGPNPLHNDIGGMKTLDSGRPNRVIPVRTDPFHNGFDSKKRVYPGGPDPLHVGYDRTKRVVRGSPDPVHYGYDGTKRVVPGSPEYEYDGTKREVPGGLDPLRNGFNRMKMAGAPGRPDPLRYDVVPGGSGLSQIGYDSMKRVVPLGPDPIHNGYNG